jgi:hypothetical protein
MEKRSLKEEVEEFELLERARPHWIIGDNSEPKEGEFYFYIGLLIGFIYGTSFLLLAIVFLSRL